MTENIHKKNTWQMACSKIPLVQNNDKNPSTNAVYSAFKKAKKKHVSMNHTSISDTLNSRLLSDILKGPYDGKLLQTVFYPLFL